MFTALFEAAPRAIRMRCVLVVFLTGAAPQVFAQPALTLDHALRLAQERSRQLVARITRLRPRARWLWPLLSFPIRRDCGHQQSSINGPDRSADAGFHDDAFVGRDAAVHA